MLGNSGAVIKMRANTVEKGAESIYDRCYVGLKSQACRQAMFADGGGIQRVVGLRAPKVLSMCASGFTMERVYGQTPLLCDEWEIPIARLIRFVSNNIRTAVHSGELVPMHAFASKTYAVITRISHYADQLPVSMYNHFIPIARRCIDAFYRYPGGVPSGYCHGDLTTCNVIQCHDGDTYLIDFAPESTINTPLLDMVKLRQDTRHGWIQLFEPTVDAARMWIADDAIDIPFRRFEWYCKLYDAVAALDMLRIVPYSLDKPAVLEWIAKGLERCTP